jgi:hypothetical protein
MGVAPFVTIFSLSNARSLTFSPLEGDVRDRLERPGEGGTRHHPPHRAPQPSRSSVLAFPTRLQQNGHEILQVRPIEEGRAASKSPRLKFVYFLFQQEVSANITQNSVVPQ